MQRQTPSATPLAQPVDLGGSWNATDADVAVRLHPQYGPALGRLPDGPAVFRGLPFALGQRSAGKRWLLADRPVEVALPGGAASHLVLAHFADSWRNAAGERDPGVPVGWVLPTGEQLAAYELRFTDGTSRRITVRRRFEIADGIIGWGFLPFEAVGYRMDEPVDWRGPHPRLTPGLYAPAGQAGPLTMLPGAWGPAQVGVADFVPTLEGDIMYWLHAIPLVPGEQLASLRITPLGGGRPGTDVVVAGITLFRGTSNPLRLEPRRQIQVTGAGPALPSVDLGVAIRALAPEARSTEGSAIVGWGRARGAAEPPVGGPVIVDMAAAPDAELTWGDWRVPIADLQRERTSPDGRISIRPLPTVSIRVDIRLTADGEPAPARVRFLAEDGRYLPPLGHRDEINPGLVEETGADLLLGGDSFAYVPGEFQIDLPPGAVEVEAVKGFDHLPVRQQVTVGPDTRTLEFALVRAIDLRKDGWRTSDSHVHFLAPTTALLQAAGEDVNFVHLLAAQLGDHFTNIMDLPWGSAVDPTGRHAVIVGTENRQNVLGHLALLGARRPVMPLSAGGGPEGRLGGAVTDLLADWEERCRAEGGLVVGAHFPLPLAEIAADVVAGRIDAVEMQCFAPGLDNPSILEWYRFLNCGYRLPILGGTDKMSAEVPVGAVRTYARMDPDAAPTFDAWAAAVRAGRTFATSGPVIELAVDGHEPGDVIALPASGGRLQATVRARAAQPVIACLELVVNGRVVDRQDAPADASDLRLDALVDVTAGSWIAARSRSRHELHSAFATSMAAHSSPVYVEVADHPQFATDDAEAILAVIDGTGRWLETMAAIDSPALRAEMVRRITASGDGLRERISGAGRASGAGPQ
jgi:hypothetical protein